MIELTMRLEVSPELYLRPFVLADGPSFVEAACESVQSVSPWLPWCHHGYALCEAETWFDLCEQYWLADFAYEYGIFSTRTAQVLGGIAINDLNKEHHFGNLGYWVRTSCQGQGIATQCVNTLAQFGFNSLYLSRIEIVVALNNQASRRVAEKAGAVFEGVARNRLNLYGKACDAAMYSLIPR